MTTYLCILNPGKEGKGIPHGRPGPEVSTRSTQDAFSKSDLPKCATIS